MLHSTYSITLRVLLLCLCVECERTIQTFEGEIGAGNSTFFTLKSEGSVTLIVNSVEGDADIYISERTTKPDFDHYDLQSTTCGKDIVTIPSWYGRPIGIAIYGHIYSPLSKYTMTVVMDYAEDTDGDESQLGSPDDLEPEQSVLWMIFVNVLKIIFEILV